MKRWIRACIIVGLILMAAGIGAMTVAAALGAVPSHYVDDVSRRLWAAVDHVQSAEDHLVRPANPERGERGSGAPVLESYEQVENLEVEVKVGRVKIVSGEGDELIVEYGEDLEVRCGLDDNSLKVENCGPFDPESKAVGWVTITVPSGKRLREMSVRVVTGMAEVDAVAAESLDLQVNTGSAAVKDGSFSRLTAGCETGRIDFKGRVDGHVTADCRTGLIRLGLEGGEDEYNYSLKSSTGRIRVGDDSFFSLDGDTRTVGGQAPFDMDLNCDTGSIDVQFN